MMPKLPPTAAPIQAKQAPTNLPPTNLPQETPSPPPIVAPQAPPTAAAPAVLPFGPDLAMAIADLDLLERLEPDDHIWNRRKNSRQRKTPISSTEFARWYKRELETVGIAYRNPHQTRHTFHWLLRHVEKLDLEQRQVMMRHDSSNTTTDQYPVVDIEEIARTRAGIR